MLIKITENKHQYIVPVIKNFPITACANLEIFLHNSMLKYVTILIVY